MLSKDDILNAMHKASEGHLRKREVRWMLEHEDDYADQMVSDLESGEYKANLSYRPLERVGVNGKKRDIKTPSLYTRVLQIAFNQAVLPIYRKHDPMIAFNCKERCGITASNRRGSLLHRLKHVFYDRRDLRWGLVIDQRRCYAHVRPKVVRRKLLALTHDRWLTDFGMSVIFTPEGEFPVGTPSSPLAHHIVMLDFDRMSQTIAPVCLRYADNVFLAAHTREELEQAKWRVKNWWWYDLGLRAKRSETRVFPLSDGLDFCGFKVIRNPNHGVSDHDKGFTKVRLSTEKRMKRCRDDRAWASYYGILKHADGFRLMTDIEKTMKLHELSQKIRIDRRMDAPNIEVKELADTGILFAVHDYELRRDREGKANWVKCLIGIPDAETGKVLAREFHGGYTGIADALELWEKVFGKDAILPIEGCEIVNQCGYIFKGSTNQIKYIEEYDSNRQGASA